MPIEIKTTEYTLKIVVIAPQGRVDAFEAPTLRKMCEAYFESGVTHFVFDLSEVTMLDLAGLAVLVSVLKRTRQNEGEVRLVWPKHEAASRILKLTKFDQVFQSIESSQIVPKGF